MAVYELTFTPAGPYFFGNEKSFRYPGQKNGGDYSNSYFIRSEDMPSQSTILGAIRYLMIPHLWGEAGYDAKENGNAIGENSFDIDGGKQSFGRIRSISPVFLRKGDDKLIAVPLNHKDGQLATYVPFTFKTTEDGKLKEYETADGKKLVADDYNAKDGLASGFVSLRDKRVYSKSEIIRSVERVSINRGRNQDGFFKKEYRFLEDRYSFAVYAELESEPLRRIVTLGQGKSPFSVGVRLCENTLEAETRALLSGCPENCAIIYCLSDCIVNGNPCDGTLFAAFQTKDYRSYTTKHAEKQRTVSKGEILHRLVKAGSIFILPSDNTDAWLNKQRNENAETIGMNHFVLIGGDI